MTMIGERQNTKSEVKNQVADAILACCCRADYVHDVRGECRRHRTAADSDSWTQREGRVSPRSTVFLGRC